MTGMWLLGAWRTAVKSELRMPGRAANRSFCAYTPSTPGSWVSSTQVLDGEPRRRPEVEPARGACPWRAEGANPRSAAWSEWVHPLQESRYSCAPQATGVPREALGGRQCPWLRDRPLGGARSSRSPCCGLAMRWTGHNPPSRCRVAHAGAAFTLPIHTAWRVHLFRSGFWPGKSARRAADELAQAEEPTDTARRRSRP